MPFDDARDNGGGTTPVGFVSNAFSRGKLNVTHPDSGRGGGSTSPAKGVVTETESLHSQNPAEATKLIRGKPEDVALVIELAMRLGVRVEPVNAIKLRGA